MFSLKFFRQLSERVTNLSNPVIGHEIVKLNAKKLLVRIDGRSPRELHTQGGLVARSTQEELLNIRFGDIEQYQKFNLNPFAYGACTSYEDLDYFVTNNKAHSDLGWIHFFYGKAACLRILKISTGIEAEEHDDEKEHLVIEDVPFDNWMASTCPQFRDKFLEGGLVPNAMHEFNHKLPKTLRRSDLASESSMLNWLLINNSEDEFAKIVADLYQDIPKERLIVRFNQDEMIVDAILSCKESSNTLSF